MGKWSVRMIATTVATAGLAVGGAAWSMLAASPAYAAGGQVTVQPSYSVSGSSTPHTECPFKVSFSGYGPGQTVTLDLVTTAPSTPADRTVYHQTFTVDDSGALTATISSADLNLTGISTNPSDTDAFYFRLLPSDGTAPQETFYAGDCGAGKTPVTTTTSTSTTTTTVKATTTTAPATTTPTTAAPVQVLGEQLTAAPQAPAPAQVLGNRITAAAPKLAATGPSDTTALLELAAILVGLGLLVTLAASRPWLRDDPSRS